MTTIETIIKASATADTIRSMDNKTVKDIAISILAKNCGRKVRRSEVSIRQCRTIVLQAVMLHGYKL